MQVVQLENLSFRYSGREGFVFKDVNFSVKKGELICVSGLSGSGKSSLFKVINGLIPGYVRGDFSGRVKLLGKDTENLEVSEISKIVGTVFQNPEFQLINNFVYEEMMPENCDESLERIGISRLKFSRINELSSGEKQKVAIASIVSYQPEIFLFDEPASNLDEESESRFADIITFLKESGKTVFIIDHQPDKFIYLIDKFLTVMKGKIVEEHLPVKAFSFGKNPVTKPEEQIVMQVQGIGRSYNGRKVLDDLSLDLHKSEVVGITGPNGGGKTTFVKIIAGMEKKDRGEMRKDSARTGIVLQNPAHQVFCDIVHEEVSFPAHNFGVYSDKKIKQILDTMGLECYKDNPVFNLSFGEMERTTISSIMAMEPDVMILDEPTLGQDEMYLQKLVNYIYAKSEGGKSFIIISHNVDFLKSICHRVFSLENGRFEMVYGID